MMNLTDREWVLEKLDLQLTDWFSDDCDLFIYTNSTCDGYDVYMYTDNPGGRIDFENEMYYYSDTICSRFQEEIEQGIISRGDKIYLDCEEDYLPEWMWSELKEFLLEQDDE